MASDSGNVLDIVEALLSNPQVRTSFVRAVAVNRDTRETPQFHQSIEEETASTFRSPRTSRNSISVTSNSTEFQVTKNSPKWVLNLDTGFRFSNPYSNWSHRPGRVSGHMLRAHMCIITNNNCLILTCIITTDFRLNPDFWQLLTYSSVLW